MFGLTVWSARWTTSKSAGLPTPQERSGHRIGTTLLDEFLNSALLCATMASIANGLAGRRAVRLMGPLQVFLPPEPNMFNVVRNNLVATDTDPHVVQNLNDFLRCQSGRHTPYARGVPWPQKPFSWQQSLIGQR